MRECELARITLSLQATHYDTIPAWQGRTLQAVYLNAMRALAPDVSHAIHDGHGYHPYTLSDVLPLVRTELRDLVPRQPLTVVLTTLHPDVTHLTLNAVVPGWLETGIDLHGQLVRVTQADVEQARYADLLEAAHAAPVRYLPMRFATPTAIKKSRRASETGERRESQVLPLPVPDRIFGSLLDRWNCFAPQPMPEGVRAFIEDEVCVHYASIHTHFVDRQRANKGSTTGFMGDVTFYCTRSESPWLGCVNALAAFARFSGVGIKTTQGMGTVLPQPSREKAVQP